MANPEHLKILEQGVEVWNRWREENPDILPRLEGVDLREADLRGANFSEADLRDGNLSKANLSEAQFGGACLYDTNLKGAWLGGTDLRGAQLFSADLSYAYLDTADLTAAYLNDVDLTGADLSGAVLWATALINLDLSNIQDLDAFSYLGPSTIDHLTLERSGPLPLTFLRGVGLPDNYIDHIPSLFNQPLQFYSCFISYSSKDQEFAERLYADLQNKGVRCWYAPEDLPIGAKIRVGIDEAIRRYDKLLLILSESSVNSQWVEQEVETALEKERDRNNQVVLFPVRLDDSVMESGDGWTRLIKNTRNIGDFSRWKDHDRYQRSFDRLVRDLKASLVAKG